MFETLKNAIDVAETVNRLFKYEKDSIVTALDDYNGRTDLEKWEARGKEEYTLELELLNEVEKLIQKWVKNQM